MLVVGCGGSYRRLWRCSSDEEAQVAAAAPGPTQLVLHDASGAHAATLVDGEMEAGAYVQWVDVSELAAGVYVVVLRTPTLVLSERMVVQR